MMRYLCLWLICFMLGRKFHVKYKRKRTAENFVYHFRVHGILIFCFLYFGWLCFLINNNSDSLCQLKYKHKFMSAIYFDWIPICFIKCKNISFGKQNSCCSFNIASFNIAILIWCEERGKRFKSYANYLFYNFCDL